MTHLSVRIGRDTEYRPQITLFSSFVDDSELPVYYVYSIIFIFSYVFAYFCFCLYLVSLFIVTLCPSNLFSDIYFRRLVLSPYTCIHANENGPDLDREISRDFNKICNIFKKYLIISLQVYLKQQNMVKKIIKL